MAAAWLRRGCDVGATRVTTRGGSRHLPIFVFSISYLATDFRISYFAFQFFLLLLLLSSKRNIDNVEYFVVIIINKMTDSGINVP